MTRFARLSFFCVLGLYVLGCTTSTGDGDDGLSQVSGDGSNGVAVGSSDASVETDDFRQFDFDGAEVWVRSLPTELPQAASIIQLTTTLIDSGDGPELCWSVVLESLPPQCAGPVVTGLADGWWTDEAGGVRWAGKTVTVAWPPVDGAVELIEDQAHVPRRIPDHPTRLDLPRECASIERFVEYETLREWEKANPDRNSQVRVVEDATIAVLAVDGDLDSVRAELTTGDLQPCVVPIGYKRAELKAAQDAIGELFDAGLYLSRTGGGNAYERVTVELLVADQHTVGRIIEAVENPDMLLITGRAIIVDGD